MCAVRKVPHSAVQDGLFPTPVKCASDVSFILTFRIYKIFVKTHKKPKIFERKNVLSSQEKIHLVKICIPIFLNRIKITTARFQLIRTIHRHVIFATMFSWMHTMYGNFLCVPETSCIFVALSDLQRFSTLTHYV